MKTRANAAARFTRALIRLLAGALAVSASAAVRLPALISEHMVLAREGSAPIWGWADPGEAVAVSIAGQRRQTIAGTDGRWQVTFRDLQASGPQCLTVEGSKVVTVDDVLLGEVWLASGQSNMAVTVASARQFEAERARAMVPALRVFMVATEFASAPADDVRGRWIEIRPETVGELAAVPYFFGRELQRRIGQPVGVIVSVWGATAIQAWTSRPAQEVVPALAPVLAHKFSTSIPSPKDPQNLADRKNDPGVLFNAMIAPLIPYPIRGVIWYQGENNTRDVEFARLYGRQLRVLIGDWRSRWGRGELPFAWVQLPNFSGKGRPGWVLVQEQMLQTLDMPNTGMIVTNDIGDPANLHPTNKQDVGARLAMWAAGAVYGQDAETSGPLPAQSDVRDGAIVVHFRHTRGGLVARGGALHGFEVAGVDRRWHAASAVIEGDRVVVSSAAVTEPRAVRYAWRPNPDANLYNGAGLPASPFRTKDWE